MNKNMKKFISKNASKTEEIANNLAKNVEKGTVIALKGDLGAGKTTFVRGFCKALGIDGVNSPTFTIVNDYGSVYHIDAYRLEGENPEDIGIWDYLNSERIILIEWPEFVNIDYDIVVTITGSGDEVREISVSSHTKPPAGCTRNA